MGSNEQTLGVYERHFDRYIEGTVQETGLDHFQGRWVADILERIPKDGKILEIGSAFGRDARFMESLGYQPELSDAFDAAVEYLNQNGFKARKLNVLEDDITSTHDLIIASAVFLHFTEEEFRTVLQKIKNSLKPGGLVAFSVKNGDGEEWADHKMGEARYFHYWRAPEIEALLRESGYNLEDVRESDDHKWLHFMSSPQGTE